MWWPSAFTSACCVYVKYGYGNFISVLESLCCFATNFGYLVIVICNLFYKIYFYMPRQHPLALGLLILDVSQSHSVWHITLGGTPLDEWSGPSKRPLLNNTQHLQQTILHTPCGIRTRNPSKRVAADPLLIQHSHRDRLKTYLLFVCHVIVIIWRCWLEVSPTRPTMRSLFRLGEFCIANCILLTHVQEGEWSRYNRFVTIHTHRKRPALFVRTSKDPIHICATLNEITRVL